jgi:N-acetylglutamate synthase
LSDDVIRRYEHLTLELWPAAERTTRHGWVLTAGLGRVHRTNAVWPLVFDGADLEAAIDDVEDWYRARGLPPAFKIVEDHCSPDDLVARLRARGYRADSVSLIMTAPTAAYVTRDPSPGRVRLDPAPGRAMHEVFAVSSKDATDRDERLSILARVPQPARFAAVEMDGQPVACGMGAARDGVLLVAAMRTHPDHRRQGHARAILDALARFGVAEGASTMLLQVEEQNPPARALYEPAARPLARYATWSRAT